MIHLVPVVGSMPNALGQRTEPTVCTYNNLTMSIPADSVDRVATHVNFKLLGHKNMNLNLR